MISTWLAKVLRDPEQHSLFDEVKHPGQQPHRATLAAGLRRTAGSVLSRRALLRGAALAAVAPMIQRGRFCPFAQADHAYSQRALDLVQRSTVIDMLGLLTLDYSKLCSWDADPNVFESRDFHKLKASGITIFHPAGGFTSGDLYTSSIRNVAGWNRFIALHNSEFMRIDCRADFELAKVSSKIGIVIGLQNSGHFRTLEDVDLFYDLGQRVSQLTYDRQRNRWRIHRSARFWS
jgi:membrane dipeptidase